MIKRAIILCLFAANAQAKCSNPVASAYSATHLVVSENGRGCWAAWPNEERNSVCLVAATKDKCNSATARKIVVAWVTNRQSAFSGLLGVDPVNDPALRAVWEPERVKLADVNR